MLSNKSKVSHLKCQKGQALVELVVLLPVLVMLFGFLMNVGNSINLGINQQKVTRAYFYSYIKNNSMYPENDTFYPDSPTLQWNQFGMTFIGWRENFKPGTRKPRLTCLRLKIPYLPSTEPTCESYKSEQTEFVRIGVVYGLCGSTYTKSSNLSEFFRGVAINGQDVASEGACIIK